MIIELFGPPAAGKTTFARRLAAHLQASGRPVELILSVRPAEANETSARAACAPPPWASVRRLTRSAMELLACIGQMSAGSHKSGIASKLLDLLPPANSMSWVRLRQYIERLESSWRLAERSDATVIFDQGFVQVICSLLLYVRAPTRSAVEQAVTLIPKADQWIHVGAPRPVLRARLEARRQSQSWIERRFELDTETSLRSVEILNMLESILQRCDPRVRRIGAPGSWSPLDPETTGSSAATRHPGWPGMRAR